MSDETIVIELPKKELAELHAFWVERITASSPTEPKMQAVTKRIRQMVFEQYRAQGAGGMNPETLRVTLELEKVKDV
ncbi:MAG: hypothetical protein JETCAE01_34460 [Anaerolineaceae bacterium]|nr:MAG: hypothetical protein JETCAE01_34460 [Anaerolineaceae bacterium]